MLRTLNIIRFRGIDNLDLGELDQINIIAGPNNSGKTSILEMIESLESPNSFYKWGMIGKRNNSGTGVPVMYDLIDSLFSVRNHSRDSSIGYSGVLDNEENFSVTLTRESGKMLLTLERAQELGMIENISNENRESIENFNFETEFMEIGYILNGQKCGQDIIYQAQKKFGSPVNRSLKCIIDNIVYVSPAQHNQNMKYLNYILSIPVLYERFVKIMKKFDQDFISLNAVESVRGLQYMVLSQGHTKALSLNAYGDGMKKAMLLLGAVIKAQNGILLLDEFETAIHVSAMKDVFRWIIETAVELNVQIFMTSHSLEAIEAVLSADAGMHQHIRMLTLADVDGEIRVRNVDGGRALQMLNEYGLELR